MNFSEENISKIRKSVGLVFQDPDDQLFMPTVLEDVMFGPKNFGFSDELVEKNISDSLSMSALTFVGRPKSEVTMLIAEVAISSTLRSKSKLKDVTLIGNDILKETTTSDESQL